MALSSRRNRFQTAGQRLRILNRRAVRAHGHRAYANVNADGRSILQRRRRLTVFNAEAGEPGPSRSSQTCNAIQRSPEPRSDIIRATNP